MNIQSYSERALDVTIKLINKYQIQNMKLMWVERESERSVIGPR